MCGTMFKYQKTATHARVWQVRCKSWTCKTCGKRRARKLRAQAIAGRPRTFLTLTVKPDLYRDPTHAAQELSKHWRALRRLIERKYPGQPGRYLTVMEATKKGWPHLHVLTTRPWIDYEWLRDTWQRLTGAWNVWIERVRDDRGAAIYVAKYMGKAPHRFGKQKRYYMTRGYCPKWERGPDVINWRDVPFIEHHGDWAVGQTILLSEGYRVTRTGSEFWELERPPPSSAVALAP